MKFIGKFIISERRGAICSLRGRCKKGRGGGGEGEGGGEREEGATSLYLKNSLQRVRDRPLNGSVLLLVSLFPTVGHTKTAGDSSSSKNTLLRFIRT